MSSSPIGFVLPGLALGFGALVFRPNRRGFFPFNAAGAPLAPIVAQATIEEAHTDTLEITQHPVEVGATISDHAYKRPEEVVIRCAWSNSPSPPASIVSQAVGIAASVFGFPVGAIASIPQTANAVQSILSGKGPNQVNDIYQKLLALQVSRVPFDILTGKRAYRNMLFETLRTDTTSEFENSMVIVAHCKEVIITRTQFVLLDTTVQADPSKTGPTQEQGNQSLQPAPTIMPDPGTVSGALNDAQQALTQVSTTLTSAPAAFAGPLAQLPTVVTSAIDSISTVTSQLPAALNIPAIPSAQIMSIPLGTTDLGPAFKDALAGLPAVFDDVQAGLQEAARQIPTLRTALPPSMSGLSSVIQAAQDAINNSRVQLQKINIQ